MSSNVFDNSKPKVVCPGPTSEAGRAISSKNARKHGCCAVDAALLPTESAEDFKALEQTWLKAYSPQNETERHLVAELVSADWLLQRATQTVLDIETRLYSENPNPLDWTDQHQRTLGRFLRYKTAYLNSVLKCRKAIEDYRKTRTAEKTAQQKQEKAGQQDNPMANWKQHLEGMRQQAIALGYAPPER